MIIAGPCAAEQSVNWLVDWACTLHEAFLSVNPAGKEDFVFKASFDKANRTSKHGNRGLGLEKTILAFENIKKVLGIRITTDVHEIWQVPLLRGVIDLAQIPAYLSRQTDLIVAAGEKIGAVNIKRMTNMTEVAASEATKKAGVRNDVYMTYRGTQYGPHALVVDVHDLINLSDLFPTTLVLDVTHTNHGIRDRSEEIMGTGVVCGIEHYFMEVHPDPDRAVCDSAHQLSLDEATVLFEVYGRVAKM